jgi:penicillin amidase
LENPESGIIVTANSVPDYGISQGEFLGYWQHPDRYNRIHELLAQKEKWSLEELKTVQTDETVHLYASRRDQLISLIDQDKLKPQINEILKQFSHWQGNADKNSAGGALYYTWTHYLIKELVLDEMGEELYKKLGKAADYMFFLDKILINKKSLWWDNVQTKDKSESSDEIALIALEAAIAHLTEVSGKNYSDWKWGDIHRLTFEHPAGRKWPLNYLFNLGPYPIGGGTSLINNTAWSRSDLTFDTKVGASARRLVDFSNPRESFGVLPTGNSGHRWSQFHQADKEFHLANKYRAQIMDFDKVGQDLKLTLQPGD